jgi:hypothetical protein
MLRQGVAVRMTAVIGTAANPRSLILAKDEQRQCRHCRTCPCAPTVWNRS